MTKIVSGKAFAAAHIENMGKANNAASGDFGHNPEGRDDLASALSRLCLFANGQTALDAPSPEAKSSPSHS